MSQIKYEKQFDLEKKISDNYDRVMNKIEEECHFSNSAFVLTMILLAMDKKTWKVDTSFLTRIYQAINIVEQDEELKKLYQSN